jgi:hypothetical protein
MKLSMVRAYQAIEKAPMEQFLRWYKNSGYTMNNLRSLLYEKGVNCSTATDHDLYSIYSIFDFSDDDFVSFCMKNCL